MLLSKGGVQDTISQRRRRLALVANNARYPILPGPDCPHLASRVLALCCDRLAEDWQKIYGHPVLLVEIFVNSQLFRGTCYKAQGWKLLEKTQGNGRSRLDYYTAKSRASRRDAHANPPILVHRKPLAPASRRQRRRGQQPRAQPQYHSWC